MKENLVSSPLSRWTVEAVAKLLRLAEYPLEKAGQDRASFLLARIADELQKFAGASREPVGLAEESGFFAGLLAAVEVGVTFFLREEDGPVGEEDDTGNPDVYALAALLLARATDCLVRAGEKELARAVFGVLRGFVKKESKLRCKAEGLA